jgi:hypothetical protein
MKRTPPPFSMESDNTGSRTPRNWINDRWHELLKPGAENKRTLLLEERTRTFFDQAKEN